jgi:hypothetical protein
MYRALAAAGLVEGFDPLLLARRQQGRGQQRRELHEEEEEEEDTVAFTMGALTTLVKAELVALGKALGIPKPLLARGDRLALLAALRSRVAAALGDAAAPAATCGSGGSGHYGAKPPDVGVKVGVYVCKLA